MVQLTIYRDINGTMVDRSGARTVRSTVETLEEAIRLGQNSGSYYEIFDMASGRIIDWNEVNIKSEDEWYYDEPEMIWKKRGTESQVPEPFSSIFDWFGTFRNENQTCRLSY